VHKDNIKSENYYNYGKLKNGLIGDYKDIETPYDRMSRMHYGGTFLITDEAAKRGRLGVSER